MQDSKLEVSGTSSLADWMATHKATELSRIKQNLNSTARPYFLYINKSCQYIMFVSDKRIPNKLF